MITENDQTETADPLAIDLHADHPILFHSTGLRFIDELRQESARRRLSIHELGQRCQCPEELLHDLLNWQPGEDMPWGIAWCLALEAVARSGGRTLRALGKRTATEELYRVLDRALIPAGWSWEHVCTRLVRPQCARKSELSAEEEFEAICGLLDRLAGGLGMALIMAPMRKGDDHPVTSG